MVYYPTKTNQSPWPRPPWQAVAGAGAAGLMSYNRMYRPSPSGNGYGRTTVNQLTNARTSFKRKRTSFKAKVLQAEPAKHYSFGSTQAMTHDTIYTLIPTGGITQGTGNTNRIGDTAHLAALKIKGYFQSASASNAYTFRLLVGWTGEEYALPTVFGIGLSAGEIFLPNTSAWQANGIVNPKTFTVLYDTNIDINSQVALTADLQSFAFSVPINQDFDYQAAGSTFGKSKNLAIVIIGEIAGGVSGATVTGLCSLSYDLIFK